MFLVTSCFSNTEKDLDDTSYLLGTPLYELNESRVDKIVKDFIEKHYNTKYVIVYDSLVNEKLISYYKDLDGNWIKKHFDEKKYKSKCKITSSFINHENEHIGKIVACYDENSVSLNLTKEEKKWIESNPIIKVHNELSWAPYNFNIDGKPLGYSVDYIKILSEMAGLEVEFVSGTWDELLKKSYNKEIDVMMNIAKTKEREKHLLYVGVFTRNITSILTKEERIDITNIESLFGKKVSVVKGFFYGKYLREVYPKIELVEYGSTFDAIKAVVYNEVDATIGKTAISDYLIAENNIEGLKYTADVKANDPEVDNLYIAVRNDAPQLQSILKKAMRSLSLMNIDNLKLKWFNQKRRVSFNKEEYQWLDEKRVIKYSEINWRPLSIIENNSMNGIMGDYLNIIAETTGIEFQYVPSSSWPEVLEKFKKGEIDLVPSKDESSLGPISKMYASYPMVIVTNNNIEYVKSIESVKKEIFSLPKGYTSYKYIKKLYPDAKIIEEKDVFQSLINVSNGEADVFVGHIAPTLYYMSKIGKDNLKIAGNAGIEFKHHFLVSPQIPELLSIINKVLKTITDKERERIYNGWVKVKVEQNTGFSIKKILYYFLPPIVVVMLLGLIVLYWNRKLSSLVNKKTTDIKKQKEELQSLVNSFDRNVIFVQTDLKGVITHPSKAFCEISGYARGELINKPTSILRHPEMPKEKFKELWKTIKTESQWRGEIKNRAKNGSEFWVFSKIEPEYNNNNEHIGYKSISQDITNKKIVEDLSRNLEKKVEERTIDLEKAMAEIELMHKSTQDSIEYASLLQHALIPSNDLFKKYFSDYLTIWHPKDIVGGDIYLFEELREEKECLLMVIDCTGHGVPGAFVTMLVKAIERQIISKIVNSDEIVSPAKILSIFNRSMKHLLKQEDDDSISNAGFDCGILYYNKSKKIVKFAGAEVPLFYEFNGEVKTIKGSRHSIGYKKSNPNFEFKEHIFEAEKGMKFYITTDGYLDQNGGEKGFPFGKKRFSRIIEENYHLAFADQQELLLYEMMSYQGSNERNDDMAIVGVKI